MSSTHLLTAEVISLLSVLITVLTFFSTLIYCRVKSIEIGLDELIKRALSASAIPTAVTILLCSIDLSLLQKLAGFLQIYIALAGLSLAYVSVMPLFSPIKRRH